MASAFQHKSLREILDPTQTAKFAQSLGIKLANSSHLGHSPQIPSKANSRAMRLITTATGLSTRWQPIEEYRPDGIILSMRYEAISATCCGLLLNVQGGKTIPPLIDVFSFSSKYVTSSILIIKLKSTGLTSIIFFVFHSQRNITFYDGTQRKAMKCYA